jgi:hypothetical protein
VLTHFAGYRLSDPCLTPVERAKLQTELATWNPDIHRDLILVVTDALQQGIRPWYRKNLAQAKSFADDFHLPYLQSLENALNLVHQL